MMSCCLAGFNIMYDNATTCDYSITISDLDTSDIVSVCGMNTFSFLPVLILCYR